VHAGPVDVDGSRPLWDRVRQSLADEVERGALPPGSRVPSERALSERLGVSRVTVRRALAALEQGGVIETSPGLGRFVRMRQVEEPPNELVSFSRMAASLGLKVTSRVLVHRARPATLDEAETLSVAPGAELIELERLRLLDGVPVVIDHSLVPAAWAPGLLDLDFTATSLYDELAERHGILAWRAEYVVQAEGASRRAAELLGLSEGQPVLVARQTTVDPDRRPFQLSVLTYRGDRYRFRTTLQMPGVLPVALSGDPRG
jgi:GntR family transcriptional regulator